MRQRPSRQDQPSKGGRMQLRSAAQYVGGFFLRKSSHRLLLRWYNPCALLPPVMGFREVWNDCPFQQLRMAWGRRLLPWRRWWLSWRWWLAYPPWLASELLLPVAPRRLVLCLSPQGTLLQ